MEESILSASRAIDFELGDTEASNNFELTLSLSDTGSVDFDNWLLSQK